MDDINGGDNSEGESKGDGDGSGGWDGRRRCLR